MNSKQINSDLTPCITLEHTSKPNVAYHRRLGIWLPLQQASSIIRRGIQEGWYEADEAELGFQLFKESDSVLELGGGIGAVMASLILRINPLSYHCFEANPRLLKSVRKTLKLNRVSNTQTAMHIYNAMLSPMDSLPAIERSFFIAPDFWASSTQQLPKDAVTEEIKVKAYDFCKFIQDNAITALMCDIEGGEDELLAESVIIPTCLKKIVLEVHPWALQSSNDCQLLSNLEAQSFELLRRIGKAGNAQIWSLQRS